MANFAATMELQKLLGEGQIERAFAVALGLNDPSIVKWLCTKLEPKAVHAVSPVVVMALTQQLGGHLTSDPQATLPWLKESLGKLKPKDPQVAAAVGPVLTQLKERLEAASDALGDGPMAADVAMLTFMVNKLCREVVR